MYVDLILQYSVLEALNIEILYNEIPLYRLDQINLMDHS